MVDPQWILSGGVALVGLVALFSSRRPAFRRDFRRNVSLAVAVTSFLVVLVAIQLVLTGLELRAAALAVGEAAALPRWNGLVLAAILLLLVGSLAFLFSLGVLVWSFGGARRRGGHQRPPRASPFEPPRRADPDFY